jgi:alpha-tubulin suppressor-like RCC1 family protein
MRAARPHSARALVPLIALATLLSGWASTPAAEAAPPPPTVTQISAALSHTCAVANGGVKCWGRNIVGQLGDGTTVGRTKPVDVVGLTSGVAMVSAGSGHTCAVTTAGGVKCWGRNTYGQLGDGSTTNSAMPVDVVGLTSGVAMVSAGDTHTCAVTTAGSVKCWGRNLNGQLGNASTTNSPTPVDVVGLSSGVASVSAGSTYSCAATTAGGADCWGDNSFGQLGNGDPLNGSTLTPVAVYGMTSGVSAVTTGDDHACALRTAPGNPTPGVKCWGAGGVGQLGNGANASSSAPVNVTTLTLGVTAVDAGSNHTCALKSNGGIRCWGYDNAGQLGDGGTANQNKPVAVTGLDNGMAGVAAGGSHTCVITGDGGVKCWGDNSFGQLGNGTRTSSFTPVDVTGLGGLPPDSAAPIVTIVLTNPNGGVPDGQNGWFVHAPVTGTVTVNDSTTGGSHATKATCTGVALGAASGTGTSVVSAPFTINAAGTYHLSCTGADQYGNTSGAVTKDVSLDATPPTVKVKVSPKAVYLHSSGAATVSSNVSDNIGPVVTTCDQANTSAVGNISVSCHATDQAGNTGSGSGTFTVKYKILAFGAVGGTSFPRGSTIPVQFALADAANVKISDTEAQGVASGCSATIAFTGGDPANPCVGTYDATADHFTFSLPTSASVAAGTYTLTLTIALPGGVSEKVSRSITLT